MANDEATPADERTFHMKDYEMKVAYLNGQFTRMWQRFQFFVAIQTALVGGKTALGDKPTIPLVIAGAVISVAWFIIGSEDRYLVRAYRLQANAAGKASAHSMVNATDAESYEPVGRLEPPSKELANELAKRSRLE